MAAAWRSPKLIDLAEAAGGWPLAVLDARYALKRWLRENARINFSVVPDQADLDRAPMPLYEASRMASAEEEDYFEKWLISDLYLCRDVAEFATFAHALRAGAFKGEHPATMAASPAPAPAPAPRPRTAAPAAAPPAPPPIDHYEDEKTRAPAMAIGLAIAGVLGALALIVTVLYFFL